jgi:hypothetical protein
VEQVVLAVVGLLLLAGLARLAVGSRAPLLGPRAAASAVVADASDGVQDALGLPLATPGQGIARADSLRRSSASWVLLVAALPAALGVAARASSRVVAVLGFVRLRDRQGVPGSSRAPPMLRVV